VGQGVSLALGRHLLCGGRGLGRLGGRRVSSLAAAGAGREACRWPTTGGWRRVGSRRVPSLGSCWGLLTRCARLQRLRLRRLLLLRRCLPKRRGNRLHPRRLHPWRLHPWRHAAVGRRHALRCAGSWGWPPSRARRLHGGAIRRWCFPSAGRTRRAWRSTPLLAWRASTARRASAHAITRARSHPRRSHAHRRRLTILVAGGAIAHRLLRLLAIPHRRRLAGCAIPHWRLLLLRPIAHSRRQPLLLLHRPSRHLGARPVGGGGSGGGLLGVGLTLCLSTRVLIQAQSLHRVHAPRLDFGRNVRLRRARRSVGAVGAVGAGSTVSARRAVHAGGAVSAIPTRCTVPTGSAIPTAWRGTVTACRAAGRRVRVGRRRVRVAAVL